MKPALTFIFVCLLAQAGLAQQFSYEPKNPAFGGDTFNYNWLLSSASAQNKLTAPANPRDQQSELDQFSEGLQRQIFSALSRSLLQQQLDGIGGITEPGTFTFGTLTLEVFEGSEGLVINILDTTTGEQTQIIVPQ
tara:strand:- start:32851 stop:33258 length:408 start_codon:yes stop_codon:yes gene_type:complete